MSLSTFPNDSTLSGSNHTSTCCLSKSVYRDQVSVELLAALGTGSGNHKGTLALVGAWREVNEKELESLIEDIYAGRRSDVGRRVELEA